MGQFFASTTRLGKIENKIERSQKRAGEKASGVYWAERKLRELWAKKGIPEARQDELLAEVTAKAQPGSQVGPFRIMEGE